jgi:hypothetical protein
MAPKPVYRNTLTREQVAAMVAESVNAAEKRWATQLQEHERTGLGASLAGGVMVLGVGIAVGLWLG